MRARAAAPARHRSWSRAPHTVAAIILETGRRHQRHPRAAAGLPRRRARRSATSTASCMIADEVMAGFGRCGEWFAVDHWDVAPDLITFAKGVNSGYVPLGGVVISDAIADDLRTQRAYPGRPHLLRPPAGLRLAPSPRSTSSRRRASSSTPARSATDVIGPGCAKLADRHPSRRRGARARRVLGARAGARPRDPRAAGAVQRRRRRRRADERVRRGVQGARAVAVHPLQPHPRRAAVHHHRPTRSARASRSSTRRSRSPTSTTPAADGAPPRGSRAGCVETDRLRCRGVAAQDVAVARAHRARLVAG